MKILFLLISLLLTFLNIKAQKQYADSLQSAYASAKEDSLKVFILCDLSDYYSFLYPDSAMYYADKAIELSAKQKNAYGEALGILCKAASYDRIADFPSALQMAYRSLEIAKTLTTHKLYLMGSVYDFIGHLNHMTGNDKESVELLHHAINLMEQSGEHEENVYYGYFQLAFSLFNENKVDSSFFYINKGKKFLPFLKEKLRQPTPWLITGNLYYFTGKIDSAEKYIHEGIKMSDEKNSLFLSAVLYNTLAGIFYEKKKLDSCIFYKRKSLLLSQKYKYKIFEMEASGSLADIYGPINSDSALKYMKIMITVKDEALNDSKLRQFQQVIYEDKKRQQDLENAKAKFREDLRMYALLTAVAVFLIIAFIFWRNSRQKQRTNILLNEQKERAEMALSELKTAQAQLVQSEKMASLGELTAGIAHEIQNPLNFVNNFSEVNTELIEEMKTELEAGNKEEAISIANDVKENEQKINMHGKRADSIVKGMLQHSRSSTAQKELTDINTLVDECMRLSWHGFRSKEKSVNVTLETDFDTGIEKINVISQDVGRVFLNLFNNAFYSVAEKKKAFSPTADSAEEYDPKVSVSTKRMTDRVEIKIWDNGNGIPQTVLDKIFNPFFTTKPTGQGTGLGLSLSYDIITKGHAGELKAVTKEGGFAEFIIILPAPYNPPPENNIHLS